MTSPLRNIHGVDVVVDWAKSMARWRRFHSAIRVKAKMVRQKRRGRLRLLIGLIEVFWAGYFSSEYKDVAVFSILVLVLIFRPTGLLGKPEIEKV